MAIIKTNKISASILSAAVMFFVVGGWILVADLLEFREGTASNDWMPTEGTIKTESIRLINRDGGVNHFALNTSYIYHVDGQALRGDRIAFPNELRFTSSQQEKTTEKAEADKSMFVKYAPETPVTVFYNPANKAQCTLTRGASITNYLSQFARDLALIILAIAMVAFRFRKARPTVKALPS